MKGSNPLINSINTAVSRFFLEVRMTGRRITGIRYSPYKWEILAWVYHPRIPSVQSGTKQGPLLPIQLDLLPRWGSMAAVALPLPGIDLRERCEKFPMLQGSRNIILWLLNQKSKWFKASIEEIQWKTSPTMILNWFGIARRWPMIDKNKEYF